MTANNTAAAAKTPVIGAADLQMQFNTLINSSIAWIQTHWLQIIIAVVVGVVIVTALYALRRLGARLCRPDAPRGAWRTIAGRAISKTTNYFIIMVAVRLVDGYAAPPPAVATTIGVLFTIAMVIQCAIWAREIILGLIEHRTRSEHYRGEAINNAMGIIRLLVSFAVFAIAVIVLLDNLGVNVTGLVAGLGVGGIAIGLAAQGIFADLFAALAIIFDRPFSRGDAITYDKSSGTVEAIGLKSTRIRGVNGEERIISNKNLLDKEILNNTKRDYRRIVFTLGVVQSTPITQMQKLPEMMKQEIEAQKFKFVRAGFKEFGASSYDFDVEFDSPTAGFQDMFDGRHAVGLAIIRRLNDEGISLAYPTQTGITAAEAGMVAPDDPPAKPSRRRKAAVSAPPSSGGRSAVDQEHGE